MNYWYRNISGKYHLARLDWVRSGRAVCGADIRYPAFEAKSGQIPVWRAACKHCLKKGA